MTHYQLQQALKTLRDQGYDVKVKLNAKTFLLQAEYDRLQQEISAVETVELSEPEVYQIITETGFVSLTTNHESTEEFINSGILDNCVNVENWDCGDVRNFNPDTLYCELLTPRNIAAEYIADNAPDYWATWDASYTSAIESLKPVTPALIPTPVNHGEVGIATILIVLEAWQLVATLLVPLIVQTYIAVRKITIDTTLVVEGFKHSAILAKKSLQIA
jgi:hypothetical protein